MRRAIESGLFGVLVLGACVDSPRTGTDAAGSETSETATDGTLDESGGQTGETTSDESESDESESETGDDPPEVVYPEPDWVPEDPAAHGLDPAGLEQAAAAAEAADSGCLVITRHGVIVGEWYWNGWGQGTQAPVFSVTKSITSVVAGIAVDQGLLDIDDWASDYVDEWAGTASEQVTVRNLLSNDSGRTWDFLGDYVTLTGSSDKTQYAVDLEQQHLPGDWWEYNNAGVQTLERVLTVATGEDLGDYAKTHLFEPIGMKSSYAHDASGNAITYADVSASCRDLARLGYLFLRGGQWANGEQVVSADWVAASTTKSTIHNDAYGFLWWLNQPGHWIRPSTPDRKEGDGLLILEAPVGAYTARGLRSQLIAVEPTTEIVFTRMEEVPVQDLFGSTEIESQLWAAIMGAVVE